MDIPLTTSRAYGGDTALARLLRQDGSPYDVAEVKALAAGVLAAPPALDPAGWTRANHPLSLFPVLGLD